MQSWRQQVFRIDVFSSGKSFYRNGPLTVSVLRNGRKDSCGSKENSGEQRFIKILARCLILFFLVGIGPVDLFAQNSSGGANLSLSGITGSSSNRTESFRNGNASSIVPEDRNRLNQDSNHRSQTSGVPSMPSNNNSSAINLPNTRPNGTTTLSSGSNSVETRNNTGISNNYTNSGTNANAQQPLRGAYFQDQWSHGSIGNYSNRPPKPVGKERTVPSYFPEGFLDPSVKTKPNSSSAEEAKTSFKDKDPDQSASVPISYQHRDDDEPNYEEINPRQQFRSSTMAFASLIALAAFGIFIFADYRYRCWLQSALSKNQRLLAPEAAAVDFDILEGEMEPEPALIGLFSENNYSDSLRFSEMMNRFKSSEIAEEHLIEVLPSSVVPLPDPLLDAAQEGEFFVRKQINEH